MKLTEIDSILTDLDYFQQKDVPHEAFATLRREDPVHYTERTFPYSFWSVTKFEDCYSVYCAPERFSSNHGLALTNAEVNENQYGTSMIASDPPVHNRQRRLISMRLTPRQVMPEEPHIRAIVTDIIDQVAPRGECDFVTDIAARMPTAVICEMMGVPREDWEDMFHWGNLLIGSQDPEYREEGESAREAAEKGRVGVYNYYMKLITRAAQEPRQRPGQRTDSWRDGWRREDVGHGHPGQLPAPHPWGPGDHAQRDVGRDDGTDAASGSKGQGRGGSLADQGHHRGVPALDFADHASDAHGDGRYRAAWEENRQGRQGGGLERVRQPRR